MFYYKANDNDEFIEFDENNLPSNIEQISEVRIITKDEYIDIKNPDFLNDKDEIIKFDEKIQEIEDLSIEDIFNELDEQEHFDCGSWYYFDEYFFDDFGISAYDAARAIHFGEVNWTDKYIKFNAYGNFETTNEIYYDYEKEEIVLQWIEENI